MWINTWDDEATREANLVANQYWGGINRELSGTEAAAGVAAAATGVATVAVPSPSGHPSSPC